MPSEILSCSTASASTSSYRSAAATSCLSKRRAPRKRSPSLTRARGMIDDTAKVT